MLFISHDLPVIRQMCDCIGVMQHGHLVEVAETENSFHNTEHEYSLADLPHAVQGMSREGWKSQERNTGSPVCLPIKSQKEQDEERIIQIAMALFAASFVQRSAADIKVTVASDATSLDPQEQLPGQTLGCLTCCSTP